MYDETFDNGREGFDGEEAHTTLSALLSFLCGGIPRRRWRGVRSIDPAGARGVEGQRPRGGGPHRR